MTLTPIAERLSVDWSLILPIRFVAAAGVRTRNLPLAGTRPLPCCQINKHRIQNRCPLKNTSFNLVNKVTCQNSLSN